ncbi:hypothetical protein F5I97DRAFT_1798887 [Phlebopus sp. FC_14]|nr:hypothetical protein F5I97DRAFT_1798887 [Phlebopus sp. FC_14]
MDQSPVDSLALRRPSTSRDRPARAPSGPRIRTRQKNSLDITSPSDSSIDGSSPLPATPTFSNPFSRPNSPGFDAFANPTDGSFSLSAPQLTLPVLSHPSNTADVAVQASSTTPPSPSPTPPPLPRTVPRPSHPTLVCKRSITTFHTPAPLPPPPEINFQPTPIPWKGLPLEAAQWTFSSAEFQEIVSKAIRLSAKESFVRLLSLQALETDIVKESERLETERLIAQARWKFEVGRRTMLLQALNSTAAVLSGAGDGDKENGLSLLISQLATAIGSCDAQLSSILHMSDQQSQIAVVQHRHWASALSVALRKLNKAYERQGEELKRVLAKVQTLEDELEEAWKEAEGMAAEIDDMDNQRAESDSEDDDPGLKQGSVGDDTGTLEDVTINTDLGEVVGVTAFAVASKATLVIPETAPKTDTKIDKSDARSIKSTRSKRSTRDGPSRVSRVSAARTRSRAASNASLRLPKALRTPSAIYSTPANAPPIPALPDSSQGHSFLDMGNVGNEYIRHPKRLLPMRPCSSFPRLSLMNLVC